MKLSIPLPDITDRPDFCPQPKPSSRLQDTKAAKKLAVVDERSFRTEVWTRDKGICRKCLRAVLKTISRVPERGEVHHLHGRTGDLRFEAKAAILVCCACHEQLTGRVSEKWTAVGTIVWTLPDSVVPLIDARSPITFQRLT